MRYIGHLANCQFSTLTNLQHLNISETVVRASSFYCWNCYLFSAVNIICCLYNCFDRLKANCRCFSSFELVTVSFVRIESLILETCWTILIDWFRHLFRLNAGKTHSLLPQPCSASSAHLPYFCQKRLFHGFHRMAKTMFPYVFSRYFWGFYLVSLSNLGLNSPYRYFDSQY